MDTKIDLKRIDRQDLQKLNYVRAKLALAQAEWDVLIAQMENKYTFVVQFDLLDLRTGLITNGNPLNGDH